MKNHLRGVKYVALAMIYLVLSITFFSANALAAFSYTISGSDGINGFRAADDSTDINTLSSYNVTLIDQNDVAHEMLCNNNTQNTQINCLWFYPWALTTNNEFLFTLRHQTTTPSDYPARLTVDRLAPNLNFTITRTNNGIKINYTVKDYAYSTVYGNCSGLDKIDYEVDGVTPDTILLNTTPNKCFVEGSFSVAVQPGYYSDFRVALTAYDNVGNSNNTAIEMSLDFQAPVIQDNFDIMSGGNPVEIISTNAETNVDIIIYIEDANLNKTRVYGDLRKLTTNSIYYNSYKNKTASCIPETSDNITYKCIFPGIMIRPVSSELIINITAFDNDNTYAIKELTKTITLLNNPGKPLFIGPDKSQCTTDLATCYARVGTNTLYLELAAGSNYSQNRIRYGINGVVAPIILCSFKEDKWVCFTPYAVSSTQTLHLVIAVGSYDDYGNTVPTINRNVLIDDKSPEIISSITSDISSCPVSGDTMQLTLRAREFDSPELKIYVNTTDFTDKEIQQGTCVKDTIDEWDCTMDITGFVTATEPNTRDIIVADLAGNKDSKPYKFEICTADTTVTPNIITKITSQTIPRIDRKTASWLPIKTYIPLSISKKTGTIIDMTVDNCQSDDENGLSVLDSGHYFIDNTLVLYIGYNGATLPEQEFDVNCTINARVRIGSSLYQNPEQESFTIKIRPYNNPLGTLDSALETKITDQKAALRNLDSEIQTRESVASIIGTLCDLAQLVAKINGILQTLKTIVYAVCMILQAWGVTAALGQKIWTKVGELLTTYDTEIGQRFWPTSITKGSWYGWALKFTCSLYTCQHYTVQGLYSMTVDASGLINEGIKTRDINRANELKDIIDSDPRATIKDTDGDGVPDTIIDTDGIVYTKSKDKDGNEAWIGQEGTVFTYKNDGWELTEYNHGTSHQYSQTIKLEKQGIFDRNNPLKQGQLSDDGNTYTMRNADGTETVYLYNENTKSFEQVTNTHPRPPGDIVITDNGIRIFSNDGIYRLGTDGWEKTTSDMPESNKYKYDVMGLAYKWENNVWKRINNNDVPLEFRSSLVKVAPLLVVRKNSNIIYIGNALDTEYPMNPVPVPSESGASSFSSPFIDWSNIDAGNQDLYNRNLKFYSALENEDWIINPYRSTHWDSLCAPAVLYNLQKEKQLRCKYISCLEAEQASGIPNYVCDREFGMESCLYLDSAQWHVTGGHFWDTIGPGLLKSGLTFIIGMAPYVAYDALCSTYGLGASVLLVNGWSDVGCGLAGIALQWNEIQAFATGDFWENLYGGSIPKNPSEINDYCNGVDYSE